MDYAKISFAVISTWIFASGVSPPNPMLKQENRAKMKGALEQGSFYQYVHLYLITPVVFATIAEACLIMTRQDPSNGAGQLASLFFIYKSGDAMSMRLSKFNALGGLMMIIGGSMRLWTFRALGRYFTYQVGIQENQKLIQDGLYSVVRHPAYSAIIFGYPGCVLWNLAPGSWVRESGVLSTWPGKILFTLHSSLLVAAPFLTLLRMPQEDEVLKNHFGEQWEVWAQRVRYRIIPGVY
ncbi:hypothetical protein CVT24_009169 [Panaeolus cyanescens]|uniref:Protein-S-isoprenylcysteine O-methyltransferase n=1 Tax=Panaeolus cyanescens TaxID=181874 RepID=A0A409Y8R1_9AGAR|nr:hypothetical protein CVT24_009169 [Panaeolus cyanescens]